MRVWEFSLIVRTFDSSKPAAGDGGDVEPAFQVDPVDGSQVLDDFAGDLAEVACVEVGVEFHRAEIPRQFRPRW